MSIEMIGGTTGSGETARLTAYSSFEPYELAEYRSALARVLPGVALTIQRMPTATLTERLLAEVQAPKADLILGWADTAAQTAGLQGICPGPDGQDGRDGYVRPTGFTTAFVADPALLAALGAAPIRTWTDLAQEALRGRIVFPDPGVSGAGFLAMSTLLQRYGAAEGWALLKAICANTRAFPGSAWTPAAETGLGETAIGVTVLIAAGKRRAEAPALDIVEPDDVVGAEAEVYGVLKSARDAAAARAVIDWIVSEPAEALFRAWRKTILSDSAERLFMIDSAKAVAERDANVARFRTLMHTAGHATGEVV